MTPEIVAPDGRAINQSSQSNLAWPPANETGVRLTRTERT
jgi:hypothetical protein